jgi:uncharacterized membrane protein (UPF0127 family)
MKRILLIILIILLFISSTLIFWLGLSPKTFHNFFYMFPDTGQTITSEPVLGLKGQIIIRDNTWNVEIAMNEEDRASGLSYRKDLRINDGLLFVFDSLGNHSFWMKDMLIPIDMIFFDDNWKIIRIEANLSPNSFPKIFGDKVKSKYVLEINANESISNGLQVGDMAIFLNK